MCPNSIVKSETRSFTKIGTVLVTGAGGEIGHSLIPRLVEQGVDKIVALDLRGHAGCESEVSTWGKKVEWIVGDLLDSDLLARLEHDFKFDAIFHLAALLSTTGEKNPERAHTVNVEGSLKLLGLAQCQTVARSESGAAPVKFIFPSTIAIYGLSPAVDKLATGKVKEDSHLDPITMYGCNKLYVENLGRYFARHFRMLDPTASQARIDFRAVRFPGIVSAHTVPAGGTSDYGPEMLHFAASGRAYECFVPADATLPFMVMPDAVQALLGIAAAPSENLTRLVYNVTSFSISAAQIRERVLKAFPSAAITFNPHRARAAIVASWPADMDDSAARADWGWSPEYDCDRAFADYLVPAITARYRQPSSSCQQSCVGA